MHFSSDQFEANREDNRKLLRPDAIPNLLTAYRAIVDCERVTEESALPQASNIEEVAYSKRMRIDTSFRSDHDYLSVNEGICFLSFLSQCFQFLSYYLLSLIYS